jgi:hypothetical protein
MANDPRLAAVASLIVYVLILLEHERAEATFAERPGSGGAHRPAAKHDNVKAR